MIEIIVILAACIILLLPIKASGWRRLRPVIAILTLGFLLIPLFFVNNETVNVRIRATLARNSEAEGNEIHIEGVEFDGVAQDLFTLFPNNTWNRVENRLAWRVYDEGSQTTIYDKWQTADEYRLYFEKSKWRGIVEVQIGDEIYTVDCYAPAEYGETEVLAVPGITGAARVSKLIAYISAAAVMILLCVFIPIAVKFSKPAAREPGVMYREGWSDILRLLSAVFIIVIGASGGVFTEYGLGYPSGMGHMLLYTFSTFAIPTFLMLTGAFLLHRDESPQNTLKKRTPSVVVPLAALVALSLLTTGYWTSGGGAAVSFITGALLGSYDAVPTFLILLSLLYILAPVFRPIFARREKSTELYAVCVVCALPAAAFTALSVFGVGGKLVTVVALTSYIGQFILGAYLMSCKESLSKKWFLPFLFTIIGFALAVASRIFLADIYAKPTPFGAGIETTLMSGGLFALFMSFAPSVDAAPKAPRFNAFIKQAASLAVGMLIIQSVLLRKIPSLTLGGITLEINSRSILSSLGMCVFYIVISLATSYIISTVPVFKRIIGLDWYTAGRQAPRA